MLFAMLYLIMRRFAGWAAGPANEEGSKDVEILVLRHQLKVLRRRAGRPLDVYSHVLPTMQAEAARSFDRLFAAG